MTVSSLTYLYYDDRTQATEIHFFCGRVRSDMISKSVEVSITKTSIRKLRLHCVEYECTDAGGIVSNYGPNIIYSIFKIINSSTRIGVSNLKD